ncbi:MAG: hypothetical protein KAI24_09150 [Planctomycetes bacterium]|nr:hypothetical protein [Planctomycetota bacterium]
MHRPSHVIGLVAAALLLAAAATGQKMAWQIPHRGAHVFDRATLEFAVTPPPSKYRPTVAIHDGRAAEPHRWRYFTCARAKVPAGFEAPGYDDSGWFVGLGGFGPTPGKTGNHRTAWNNDVCCLRTTVDLGKSKPKVLWFEVDHDDGIRIWLNGELIVADDGYGVGREYFVTGKALDAWRRGDNVLAVKCTNIGGAQYLDLGLKYFSRLARGQREVGDLKKALAAERNQANRVRRALFGPYRPPAMLLQGELAAGQTHVAHAPADLREVAWWVATDLRCGPLGGNVKLDAPRMWELGDLRIRGRATAVDELGWQTIKAKVRTTKEPDRGKDSKRFLQQSVLRFVHHGFEGDLEIRRRLDVRPDGTRVVAFETSLEGTITRGEGFKEVAAGLRQRETWKLATTHENQDTAFRLLVKKAIEQGTARLREQLAKPNAERLLKSDGPKAARSYHSGRLAIGLLALIKGGVPKDDEVLQRCLQELRKRPLIDTYTLGNALMALESYYQPATEMSLLRSGSIDRPQKRQVPDDDRALMQKWTERLLQNIDTRVDPGYLVRFNYVRAGRFDNSVHQYGLLGLYAAHLCGVEVSPTVWEAAANHLLDVQEEDGAKVSLELMDYRTHTRLQFDPDANVTVARSPSRAKGWSYTHPEHGGAESGIWGSMTCAGITGLAICQAALLDYDDVKRRKLQNDANRARNDGFAWLAANMTVRFHPGAMTRQRRWLYYYLYGLERAALLSGVALIQDRDWYFEGAMMLVLGQLENGDWPGELTADEAIERNAMAILFLKQSTSPVLTGK